MTFELTDAIDKQLATLLVGDGRATLRQLADATGLSVSAVQARVRRLESDGVIRGYTADVDPESLGLPLAGLAEIEACHSVAGSDSYVLFVRVASPTALEALIREIRRRANVSTRTTVVLQTFFERRALPGE
jgi:Lrp/AsnC family leucine-responsive transcriptional regulator